MQESMHRRVRTNGDEQDAFSRSARKHLASLQRAGVVAKTKERYARRGRREVNRTLREASHMGFGF
jgi:hypothetical protein